MSERVVSLIVAAPAIALGVTVAVRLAAARRAECESAVLETLALAARRGAPIDASLLWTISHDLRGRFRRRVLAAARELDAGTPLAEALGHAFRLAPSAVAGLAAAPDGAQLAAALARLAERRRDDDGFVRGAAARLVYPLFVLGGLALVTPRMRDVVSCSELPLPLWTVDDASALVKHCALVLSAALVACALAALPTPRAVLVRAAARWLPPSARDAAGWLDALAAYVRAGAPADVALRRASAAAGSCALARASRAVAQRASAGASLATLWGDLPLPRRVQRRAPLLVGSPERVAAALAGAAQDCRDADARARERALALLGPGTVFVAAAAVGGLLLAVLLFTQSVALGVHP